jgi:hypothetical protein
MLRIYSLCLRPPDALSVHELIDIAKIQYVIRKVKWFSTMASR